MYENRVDTGYQKHPKKPFVHRPGDFPYSTWRAVVDRGVCEDCGGEFDPEDPWHVHHIIFLGSEAAKQVPLAVLQSIANAELLHRSCHYHLHNWYDEPDPKFVDQVVQKYQEMTAEAFRLMNRPRVRRLG